MANFPKFSSCISRSEQPQTTPTPTSPSACAEPGAVGDELGLQPEPRLGAVLNVEGALEGTASLSRNDAQAVVAAELAFELNGSKLHQKLLGKLLQAGSEGLSPNQICAETNLRYRCAKKATEQGLKYLSPAAVIQNLPLIQRDGARFYHGSVRRDMSSLHGEEEQDATPTPTSPSAAINPEQPQPTPTPTSPSARAEPGVVGDDCIFSVDCLVCYERTAVIVVQPCNHLVVCEVCEALIAECPICRPDVPLRAFLP